jgi:hypothetical protein
MSQWTLKCSACGKKSLHNSIPEKRPFPGSYSLHKLEVLAPQFFPDDGLTASYSGPEDPVAGKTELWRERWDSSPRPPA